MSSTSRNRILSKLHAAPKVPLEPVVNESRVTYGELSREEKIERLKQLMEAMRTEVHAVRAGDWIDVLEKIVRKKGIGNLLYSPMTDMGAALKKHWENSDVENEKLPELIPYDGNIEDFKADLFRMAAAVTTSKGAITDAGAIILWPDEEEPRLMSLVPPVHVVVLDANTIYNNLSEAMEKENWHHRMPTNVILISGPSKTADIELTLAFGVHGPKELVVLIVDGGNA